MNINVDKLSDLEKADLLRQLVPDSSNLYIKLGNKGNVVVGGIALGQRFPVTLWPKGWLAILSMTEEIKKFIEDHKDELQWEKR